jgi:hypothetical protein
MKPSLKTITLSALTALSLTVSLTPSLAAKKEGAMTPKGILTFYFGQKFQGDSLEVKKARVTMSTDFTIGSIAVFEGDSWEICDGPKFKGYCEIITTNKTDLGKIMIRSARQIVAPKP